MFAFYKCEHRKEDKRCKSFLIMELALLPQSHAQQKGLYASVKEAPFPQIPDCCEMERGTSLGDSLNHGVAESLETLLPGRATSQLHAGLEWLVDATWLYETKARRTRLSGRANIWKGVRKYPLSANRCLHDWANLYFDLLRRTTSSGSISISRSSVMYCTLLLTLCK